MSLVKTFIKVFVLTSLAGTVIAAGVYGVYLLQKMYEAWLKTFSFSANEVGAIQVVSLVIFAISALAGFAAASDEYKKLLQKEKEA